MKTLEWVVNLALVALLAATVAGVGPGSANGDALELEGRIDRVERSARAASAHSVASDLERLSEVVSWLERSLEDADKAVEALQASYGRREGGGATGDPAESAVDDLARLALERAHGMAVRIADRLDLDPLLADQVLLIYAEHEMRVLSGRAAGDDDFPIVFRELKSILEPSQLAILVEEFGIGSAAQGDR